MVWLRSLVFQAYFFVSVCIASLMIAAFFFMPYSFRFGIVKTWGESMLVAGRWLCGLWWEVEGQENIPDVPSVIMIKHTTVFEAYAQLTIFPPQAWVLKRCLLYTSPSPRDATLSRMPSSA